jgi:lysophospholipase L1-like esterase
MAKKPGCIRVVAVGGSSTYCLRVSDEFTWPKLLQDQLGSGYEVINLGGIGNGSVEHLILTELDFSDLKPDIAIYYCGWNDAHVQHIANLKGDYSDFHGKAVMSIGLGGTQRTSVLASLYFTKRLLLHFFFPNLEAVETHGSRQVPPTKDAFTDRVDQRALDLWERNIRLIADLCKLQGVRPIFVPQIMNWEALVSDRPYGWFPYVRDRDIRKIMEAYHASMERVAKAEGVSYAGEMLGVPFSKADFVDNGHFSAEGDRRFAQVLAKRIKGK